MFDRVKQTSTTIGTASYVIGAATFPGFRTWAQAASEHATLFGGTTVVVPYLAIEGAAWEAGYGVFTPATATLTRSVITSSSNANNPVVWGAGTRDLSIAPNALGHSGLGGRNTYSGSDPSGADNENQGYRPGSVWITATADVSLRLVYVCTSAAGAAIWSLVNHPAAFRENVAGRGLTRYQPTVLNSVDTQRERTDFSQTLAESLNVDEYQPRGAIIKRSVHTTDATATVISLPAHRGVGVLLATVVLTRGDAAEGKVVEIKAGYRLALAGGTPVALGAASITTLGETVGFAGATVAVGFAAGAVTLTLTGIAATSIGWSLYGTLNELAHSPMPA